MLFLAYSGLRFGEMAALRVGRLDFVRRRAVIAESVTIVRSEQVFGTPKGHEWREVPIPAFLIDELRDYVAGKDPGDLVFTGSRSGGALRAPVFHNSAFAAAAIAIGKPGLHPHELRHTAASLAIASGADVKVVQQMLGHASAAMTLDQYGHLFGDRLDEVANRMARCPRSFCCPSVARDHIRRSRADPGESRRPRNTGPAAWCPRQDSNLRHRLRRAVLYPLSYGGRDAVEPTRQTSKA